MYGTERFKAEVFYKGFIGKSMHSFYFIIYNFNFEVLMEKNNDIEQ
ncbi:hypothetical protein [Borrelia coriaceae]|uniref:Uncharacterized protein n=1 Tax=Borrelia coriaceae ATCC 43381 TaxID=1408429 RepID=W5T362_9SPIR|nr:hypothetical protein [Borrelia coriaceae]AHH11756.1 hypothetical protein BCO_0900134 [Borrelia coriaceae ATCC 43381]